MAVFISFETAAVLLGLLLTGVKVCPKSIWLWVQEVGQRAMEQLQIQLKTLASDSLPPVKPRAAEIEALPLLLGAEA